jgi:hypothetical protein
MLTLLITARRGRVMSSLREMLERMDPVDTISVLRATLGG